MLYEVITKNTRTDTWSKTKFTIRRYQKKQGVFRQHAFDVPAPGPHQTVGFVIAAGDIENTAGPVEQQIRSRQPACVEDRITSYNVCYTKLLRRTRSRGTLPRGW